MAAFRQVMTGKKQNPWGKDALPTRYQRVARTNFFQ